MFRESGCENRRFAIEKKLFYFFISAVVLVLEPQLSTTPEP